MAAMTSFCMNNLFVHCAFGGDPQRMSRHFFASNSSMACFVRRLLLAATSWSFAVATMHAQPAQQVPPPDELLALQRHSLLAFNAAVQKKSFADFYKQEMSAAFREQFPLEKFTAICQPFLDQKNFDLSAVAKAKPVYDMPSKIDDDGVLRVQGRYLVPPDQITFKLSYVLEGNDRKLLGIKVDTDYFVGKTAKLPGEKELNALVLDTLLAFDKGVQEKDFSSFYETQAAKYWQAKISPEALQHTFQSFIDLNVQLAAAVAKLKPKFDPVPAIDADGKLVITGYYATLPSRLSFRYEYIYEEGAWKLVGLDYKLAASLDKAPPEQP